MRNVTLEWRAYRFFPYERDFAVREAESLFQTSTRRNGIYLNIPVSAFDPQCADRLTYFGRVIPPSGEAVIPRQAKLEATAQLKASNRQATRYSAHALHEYKGRFNPQVVRAIGNILGLQEGSWVLDPFCGSGTTLLECTHAGWNAVGIDRNPLAVQIANAKIRAIRSADRLRAQCARITAMLQDYAKLSRASGVSEPQMARILGPQWTTSLSAFDYLREWFGLPVLAQVAAIQTAIRKHARWIADRAVFETILSDHLRDASLQEPADLRIRRRKNVNPNYPLLDWFSAAAHDRIERVARARATLGEISTSQAAVLGDNRRVKLRAPNGGFDAVITSPPYETALPYIDTQRLSLTLLGHLSPRQILAAEQELIGCREIAPGERREIERQIVEGKSRLPCEVIELCRELLAAAAGEGNGFRRRNRPALTFRYFRNMLAFFEHLRPLMRPGGKVALVVGPSRTTLGGKEYIIDTPRLLASIGHHVGYHVAMMVEMDTYQRFDLHRRNAISSEALLVLTSPDT